MKALAPYSYYKPHLIHFAFAVIFWGLALCVNIVTERGNFIPTDEYAILALVLLLFVSLACTAPVICLFGHLSFWKRPNGEISSSYRPWFGYLLGTLVGLPLFCWSWYVPIMYGVPAYIVKSTGTPGSRIEQASHLYVKTRTRRVPSFGCTNGVTFHTSHIWQWSDGSLCLKRRDFDKLRRGQRLELHGFSSWSGFYIKNFTVPK